jgi:phospholipid/cholesterol/gamma-HCH transport system permease protein
MSDLAEDQKIARTSPLSEVFYLIGKKVLTLVEYVGGLSSLAWKTGASVGKNFVGLRDTVQQFHLIGNKSSFLTNLIAVFTGMVLAVQFIVGLKRFGLQLYTGQIIGIAIVRELGPVLTALMVAARVGSGITAELGSMTVSEQVLAIEAMGADPIRKLVVPRVVAATICTPILTVFANIIGILGGMLITVIETGVGAQYYMDQISQTVEVQDFASGLAKTLFFGFFIGVIACYQGLNTRGGTAGVGKSTTLSVVYASIVIFVSDFFLTKLFLFL